MKKCLGQAGVGCVYVCAHEQVRVCVQVCRAWRIRTDYKRIPGESSLVLDSCCLYLFPFPGAHKCACELMWDHPTLGLLGTGNGPRTATQVTEARA